ncbi:MAG: sigma 54-interacting transcriptional regulator [Desulfobulbaceae bacterium]
MFLAMDLHELRTAFLFQGIDDAGLEPVASCARERIFEPGEYVYRRGDEGREFYVIAGGSVQLVVEEKENFSCVAEQISTGGHFGEISLLTGRPRSVDVRALTRTRLFVFDEKSFRTVLLANPVIHANLDRALAERLSLASRPGEKERPSMGRAQGTPSRIHEEGEGAAIGGMGDDLELARKIRTKILHFGACDTPVLICGEPGTGRRLTAKQIHLQSARREQPYLELDMRQFSSWIWEGKLFGYKQDSFPFSSGRQLGILEQVRGGTLVLHHAEKMSWELQQMLYHACRTGTFSSVDSEVSQEMNARLIFIADGPACAEKGDPAFIPGFRALFAENRFQLPPLREHKQDIMPLVRYYLDRFNRELGKDVRAVSPEALGMLIKYDWPGNLTELSNVIQRAVMVAEGSEILPEHIFLDSGPGERLSFNLLRLPWVRRMFSGRLMLWVSTLTFLVFCGILVALFFGPETAENNLGITLCWYVGWPLLIISFFFLPRYWCSICALSAPGKQLQKLLRPTRRLPPFITKYSGWIMALFCLLVFWAEIVFNAYDNPRLTGMILLTITMGALLVSAAFERYSWCRYLCPLGALNAVFSMPSVLELRANREMCLNQCRDYVCFRDTDVSKGCPMFRHPFLVDNNKDCILCGRCIRNCTLRSIELNLRLAPRELWSLRNVQLSDNFLIISLGVIFFYLAHHSFLSEASQRIGALFGAAGFFTPPGATTFLFAAGIAVGWLAYLFFGVLQERVLGKTAVRPVRVLGYGLLPLVLGGYLAYYAELFITGAWRIVPNGLALLGYDATWEPFRLLTPGATSTFLHIIILGGTMASAYATWKICRRLAGERFRPEHLALPLLVVFGFGMAYLLSV